MDWFRSDVGLRTHWSLPLLQQELGVNIREAAGIVRLFYDFVGTHADSGDLSEIPRHAVAAYIEWPIPDADQLFDALIKAGLVSEAEGICLVTGWQDRNKAIFRHRERQRERREGASTVRARDSQADSTVRARDSRVLDTDRQTDLHTNSKKKKPPTAGAREGEPDKPTKRSSDSSAKVEIEAFVKAWNSIKSFSTCRTITDSRIKTLRTRLKDSFWRENWRAALKRVSGNSFLSGNNDRGWKATVEWFLKPDMVAQIMEGQCDNWGGNNRSSKPPSPPQPSRFDDPKWNARQARIREVWDRQKREAKEKGKPEPKRPSEYDPKWKPKVVDGSVGDDEKVPF
ncbi:hypothetical protein LCGC14_0817180 [marine sediment metagenome]|uniref:Lin1244/Lin1753-like N-terminal domain-containing protein n=1 Tax=marine sediment metagenome TaxID=412755 RepID=A0A0F9Q5A4_9ZZZZ